MRPTRPIGPINPFEVGILIVGVMTSGSVLLGFANPASIRGQLSESFTCVWAWLLFIGSVVSLVGLLWPGQWVTGVEIKRPGLFVFSLACLTYSFAAFQLGPMGYAVGITNGGFCLIAWIRIGQVTRGIRTYRRYIAVVTSIAGR